MTSNYTKICKLFATILVMFCFSAADGCSDIGIWENFYKNCPTPKKFGIEAKTLARRLCQLDEVMAKVGTNSKQQLVQRYCQNDPAMDKIVQKLFFIYQRLKHPEAGNHISSIYLGPSLAFCVIFLANRSAIPYNEILDVLELKKNIFLLGKIRNLLIGHFAIENIEMEEEVEVENDEEAGEGQNSNNNSWAFHQISANSNGLLEKWANSVHKKEMRCRRRKRRDFAPLIIGIFLLLGLMLTVRWLLFTLDEYSSDQSGEEEEERSSHFTLPTQIGKAHMVAFDQLVGVKIAKKDGTKMCAICLSDIKPGTVIKQLPACQHPFHIECLRIWLKGYNNFCPICRTKIFTEYANGKVELNTRHHDYGTFDMV